MQVSSSNLFSDRPVTERIVSRTTIGGAHLCANINVEVVNCRATCFKNDLVAADHSHKYSHGGGRAKGQHAGRVLQERPSMCCAFVLVLM
ncbi:hypothetical protein QR680_008647 [Steinernema hermaphroditum]|uniref:Uncharacterized protein n=1 Tax=Steinernema hermaphroditum TaxID=289476 RepID=A0AA39IIQ4_9BILA|nr:hypothetical protein QR680_008647 [Steinernema hermaphroditum]